LVPHKLLSLRPLPRSPHAYIRQLFFNFYLSFHQHQHLIHFIV
jgi:hypothetical protein